MDSYFNVHQLPVQKIRLKIRNETGRPNSQGKQGAVKRLAGWLAGTHDTELYESYAEMDNLVLSLTSG